MHAVPLRAPRRNLRRPDRLVVRESLGGAAVPFREHVAPGFRGPRRPGTGLSEVYSALAVMGHQL